MFTIRVKGSLLTNIRVKQGLSMNELAKKIQTNTAVISRIESGKVCPRPSTAKRICKALGCGFDDVFEIGGR